MNTCPICGRTANEKYCSECGSLMASAAENPIQEQCYSEAPVTPIMENPVKEQYYSEVESPAVSAKPPRKGRKGAIARLVVAGLTLVITLVLAVMALFTEEGFGNAITGFFAVLGTGCVMGVVILALCKWLGFILPKSFGWANSFWRSWHALTIFGLYLKGCVWVFILLIPVSVMTSLISAACFGLVMFLINAGRNIFSVLLYLAASGGVMAVLVFLDLCKVKGIGPKAMLAHMKKSKAVRSH